MVPFAPRLELARAYDQAVSVGFNFGHVLKDVGKVVKGATGVIQGVVSLVPGIGTGISAAIGAGMTLLQGGSPLDIAVNAAFGAIPIPPGAREIAHTALDAIMSLVKTKNLGDAAVAAVRQQIPAGLPQQVFDTLAHLVLSHTRQRATTGVVTHPLNKPTKIVPLTLPSHFMNLHAIAPTPIAPSPHVAPVIRARPGVFLPPAGVLPARTLRIRGAWVFA